VRPTLMVVDARPSELQTNKNAIICKIILVQYSI